MIVTHQPLRLIQRDLPHCDELVGSSSSMIAREAPGSSSMSTRRPTTSTRQGAAGPVRSIRSSRPCRAIVKAAPTSPVVVGIAIVACAHRDHGARANQERHAVEAVLLAHPAGAVDDVAAQQIGPPPGGHVVIDIALGT